MSQKPTILWAVSKISYLILFWVIAAFVLMFAAGYRINWQGGFVKETGSIYLQTYSRDKVMVKYTLNGKEHSARLPYVIKDLQPGHYSLTVHYENYEPWSKSFYLGPSQAKLFNDILFIPTVIDSKEATASQKALITNEEKLISDGLVIRGNEIYRTDKASDELILRSSSEVDQVFWFDRKTHILVKNQKTVFIYEVDGTNGTKLFTLKNDLPIKVVVAGSGKELLVGQGEEFTVYDLSLQLKKP